MRTVDSAPKFEFGLLLKAAAAVNLNPREVPSDCNPWTWDDPRAFGWQSAIRQLDPLLAQDAEIFWGKPMSLGLAAALDGQAEMTPELDQEFAAKRPHQREEIRQAAIKQALEQMAESHALERQAMADRHRTPDQQRADQTASLNLAAAHQARQHAGIE